MPVDLALSLTIAIACIETPTRDVGGEEGAAPCPLSALRAVSIALELMDPNETRYLFVRQVELSGDLRLIRERYARLKTAPWVDDAIRFPSREVLRELMTANREYVAWLQQRQRLLRDAWIEEAIQDAEELYHVHDLAYDAQTPFYYITVRRTALSELRHAIGPHHYYAGTLPPFIPTWPLRTIE